MELAGLSTDQAPPISAPLRFFLTAPIFAILAGILILLSDSDTLFSRYSIDSIIITHAMTIGFFGFVMLGALMQMLPVLAGVKIYKVETITLYSHIMLVFGLLFMIYGLYFSAPSINLLATIFLVIGFLILLIPMLIALRGANNFTPTVKAINVSLIFSVISITIGGYLLFGYALGTVSSTHLILANIHSVWAVFGFVGILIIGVAFQVIPMFYVAPRFKQFCKQRVVHIISAGLLVWAFLNILYPEYAYIAKTWISLFFFAFTSAVWVKLNNRRRPTSDVTVWYWRISSIFMSIGFFAWIFNSYLDDEYTVIISVIIGGGFILSIMVGMLYKIIPFLVWFHLNARGYMSIPTMNEMTNKRISIAQFILYLFSIIGFIFSYFYPSILVYSALSFILSMVLLQYNIIKPVLVYVKTIKTKPDFDMSAFNMKVE